jgi:activator of HSP90 ATPase
VAKKFISENLAKITVETHNPPVKLRLYEVKSIEGSASITIRKQKQIFLYEFKIEVYFDAEDLNGKEEKRMGRVIVAEFN